MNDTCDIAADLTTVISSNISQLTPVTDIAAGFNTKKTKRTYIEVADFNWITKSGVKSECWKHFKVCLALSKFAKCNHCNEAICIGSEKGTGHLWGHLRTCHCSLLRMKST